MSQMEKSKSTVVVTPPLTSVWISDKMGCILVEFQFCNSFLEQPPIHPTNLGLHPSPAQDTVSVHRPGFYAHRFLDFCADRVFKKIPSRECCRLRLQFRFPFVYVVPLAHLVMSHERIVTISLHTTPYSIQGDTVRRFLCDDELMTKAKSSRTLKFGNLGPQYA